MSRPNHLGIDAITGNTSHGAHKKINTKNALKCSPMTKLLKISQCAMNTVYLFDKNFGNGIPRLGARSL